MNITRLIIVGSVGDDVRFVQSKLTQLKYYNGPCNGVFDRVLFLAVQNYQKTKGLEDDGKIGMLTWDSLKKDTTSIPTVTTQNDEVKVVEVIKEVTVVKEIVVNKEDNEISIENLIEIFKAKKYKWYEDRPNLIGIRTNLQLPDIFNDLFVVVYKKDGVNTLKMWTITTDPGVYWLNNPMNVNGTAYLKAGQYIDSHSIGLHQGKKEHPALVQRGKLTVYRDKDKDSIAEETSFEESGSGFGINIHRSNSTGKTAKIGQWSAGCFVFQQKSDHDELMAIVNEYKEITGNKFTLNLLKENDL